MRDSRERFPTFALPRPVLDALADLLGGGEHDVVYAYLVHVAEALSVEFICRVELEG